MSEVTRLLEGREPGRRQAAAGLLPMVYGELHAARGARDFAREQPELTLDATAAVRGVHQARRRPAIRGTTPFLRRGRRGDAAYPRRAGPTSPGHQPWRWKPARASIPTAVRLLPPTTNSSPSRGPRSLRGGFSQEKAELVKLRYFAGQTADQPRRRRHLAESTANRHWAYARAGSNAHILPGDGILSRCDFLEAS